MMDMNGGGAPPMNGGMNETPQGMPGKDSRISNVLMDRIDGLGQEELSALESIPPEAMAVLKKILPELADLATMDHGMGDDAAPAEEPPQYSMQRPTTKLNQY